MAVERIIVQIEEDDDVVARGSERGAPPPSDRELMESEKRRSRERAGGDAIPPGEQSRLSGGGIPIGQLAGSALTVGAAVSPQFGQFFAIRRIIEDIGGLLKQNADLQKAIEEDRQEALEDSRRRAEEARQRARAELDAVPFEQQGEVAERIAAEEESGIRVRPGATPNLGAAGRGGGSRAVAVQAGGAAVALGALAAAAGLAVSELNSFAGTAGRLSPSVQAAQSEVNIQRLRGDFRRSQQLEEDLANFVRAQGNLSEELLDLRAAFVEAAADLGVIELLKEIAAGVKLTKDTVGALLTLLRPIVETLAKISDSLPGPRMYLEFFEALDREFGIKETWGKLEKAIDRYVGWLNKDEADDAADRAKNAKWATEQQLNELAALAGNLLGGGQVAPPGHPDAEQAAAGPGLVEQGAGIAKNVFIAPFAPGFNAALNAFGK